MYHKTVVVGHLGRDPEMRYTPAGHPVTNFSVAANRRWTNGDGEQQEETIWVRVSVFGRLAEVCNQYLTKGRLVLVEGTLRPDTNGGPRVYQRRDGSYGASYELTAQTVKFLSGGNGNGSAAEAEEALEPEAQEEIPF